MARQVGLVAMLLLLIVPQISGLCPTATGVNWAQGATVYYSFNSNISGTELTQIQNAISLWNTANTNINNSGVSYVQADSNHPATWTISNGTTNTGVGAVTTLNTPNGDGIVTSATTVVGVGTLTSSGSPIYSPTSLVYGTIFLKVGLHEMGHMVNESDVTGSSQVAVQSVMNQIHGTNDSGNYIPTTIQSCDNNTVNNSVDYPPPDGGGSCRRQSCQANYVWSWDLCACQFQNCGCCCNNGSPIVIDVDGSGFNLTDLAHGVVFNISGTGPIQMAWTAPGSTNAFLFLDRNSNGIVDDGTELFGDFTPQPPSSHPNGYEALAVYDLPENGGNNDGVIDQNDAVFSQLRLWIDINHDGISQPGELFTLPQLGVHKISLHYHFSYRRDRFGNQFRYRSRIDDDGARVCYDVFLVTAASGGDSLLKEPPIFDLLRPKASCGGIGN